MRPPKIESYKFGHIVIDGEAHTNDVIILPDRVVGGWWRKQGHALHPEDLEAVFESAPEVLLVGSGANGRMLVTAQTREALKSADIECVNVDTNEACRRYSEMRERRSVAAALHLTC